MEHDNTPKKADGQPKVYKGHMPYFPHGYIPSGGRKAGVVFIQDRMTGRKLLDRHCHPAVNPPPLLCGGWIDDKLLTARGDAPAAQHHQPTHRPYTWNQATRP
jgi:hypothetical protein